MWSIRKGLGYVYLLFSASLSLVFIQCLFKRKKKLESKGQWGVPWGLLEKLLRLNTSSLSIRIYVTEYPCNWKTERIFPSVDTENVPLKCLKKPHNVSLHVHNVIARKWFVCCSTGKLSGLIVRKAFAWWAADGWCITDACSQWCLTFHC